MKRLPSDDDAKIRGSFQFIVFCFQLLAITLFSISFTFMDDKPIRCLYLKRLKVNKQLFTEN